MASSSGARWTKEETVLALDLYFSCRKRNKNLSYEEAARHIEKLADLGFSARSPDSIIMKMGNFAALDPHNSGKGLRSAAAQDRRVWREFAESPQKLSREVRDIESRLKASKTRSSRESPVRQHRLDRPVAQRSATEEHYTRSSGQSWRVEETVLALDLYLRCRQRGRRPTAQEISRHRDLLWRLGMPFRNANTINLKMDDLAGIDPNNPDPVLDTASRQDRRIWREFANSPQKLQEAISRINRGAR